MKKVSHYSNYQPFLVKSRSWEKIIKFYENLILDNGWNLKPMADLVKYIAVNYSFGIYGTTSMHTLCLTQTSEFELNQNVLRISLTLNRFVFVYISEGKNEQNSWKKECDIGEEIDTFEHIMKRLRWFFK